MIESLTIHRDKNGNKTLRVKIQGHRAFNIQTNGNLPCVHANGITWTTIGNVKAHVNRYGTKAQRLAIADTH
jgi:hypothetical protein